MNSQIIAGKLCPKLDITNPRLKQASSSAPQSRAGIVSLHASPSSVSPSMSFSEQPRYSTKPCPRLRNYSRKLCPGLEMINSQPSWASSSASWSSARIVSLGGSPSTSFSFTWMITTLSPLRAFANCGTCMAWAMSASRSVSDISAVGVAMCGVSTPLYSGPNVAELGPFLTGLVDLGEIGRSSPP